MGGDDASAGGDIAVAPFGFGKTDVGEIPGNALVDIPLVNSPVVVTLRDGSEIESHRAVEQRLVIVLRLYMI